MIQIAFANNKTRTRYTKSKATITDLGQVLASLEIVKKNLIEDFEKMTSIKKTDDSILDEGSGK